MVIYIDLVFITNFFINFIFISFIYLLFNDKITKKIFIRIIISSVISTLFLFAFLLNVFFYNLFKILGGMILVLISFRLTNPRKYFIQTSIYYCLELSLIGIVQSFHMQGLFLFLGILLILFLFLFQNQKRLITNTLNYYYEVIIVCLNKNIKLNGFVDTGNKSMSMGKPIIFINKKYFNKQLKSVGLVYVRTVGGTIAIECFNPNDFIICVDKIKLHKDVLIAFTDLSCDCLLNVNLFV